MGRFKSGEKAFIVESNRFIREVEIRNCSGGLYTIKFLDSRGGIKVKEHRLFATKEEAEKSMRKESKPGRNPYDYL